jgi:hypothetical protein
LGNHCPNIGQALPNSWATIAQTLGNHCPSIVQPLLRPWAIVAQALGKHCPRLPRLWVSVV